MAMNRIVCCLPPERRLAVLRYLICGLITLSDLVAAVVGAGRRTRQADKL
jgi:hypothetical protein